MDPQMPLNWQFMPFMPQYQLSLLMQMQQVAALQYNSMLIQPLFMSHIPLLIPRLHTLSAGPHQHEQGHKTVALSNNQNPHASYTAIPNDHRAISHHSQVGDYNNARSFGLAEGPPSLETSVTPHRSRAAFQDRRKRSSAFRGQRKCDDLSQYIVTGPECM